MEARSMANVLVTDVAVRAKHALARSHVYSLRELDVEAYGEALILRGEVDSFYHKQLAQELVRMAAEGVEVINDIEVDYYRQPRPERSEW
jgi:hypothetical protein